MQSEPVRESVPEESDVKATVIWQNIYEKLSQNIPEQFFSVFFNHLKAKKYVENQLFLSSDDDQVIHHIKKRYISQIEEVARAEAGENVQVEIVLDDTQENKKPIDFPGSAEKKKADTETSHQILLNPKYTFDRFIKGPSNEHAMAAAMGAAQNLNEFHNPLYIYGSVGVGKTHLMMAIGNFVLQNSPWLKIQYTPAETFQNTLFEAISKKNMSSLKARYRNVDVFLFDDIQFINERADFIQEEIFHTFNFLYQNKKQIVISGDRPPQQLSTLHDRLQSRFQSGLIVDIKPPNFETRLAILKTKAREMQLHVPQNVLEYLSARFTTQVRILEAALIKLRFVSELEKHPIDLQMTKLALRDMPNESPGQQISIDEILRTVSQTFHVNEAEIKGNSRTENIVHARHISMFLAKSLIPSMSLASIARAFGKSDHTTVLHAEKKIRDLMDMDDTLRVQIEELTNELKF